MANIVKQNDIVVNAQFNPSLGVSLSNNNGIYYDVYTQSGALEVKIDTQGMVTGGCVLLPIKSDGNAKTIKVNGTDITTIGKKSDSNDFSTTANDIDEVLIYNGVKTATNPTGVWYRVSNLGA